LVVLGGRDPKAGVPNTTWGLGVSGCQWPVSRKPPLVGILILIEAADAQTSP